jgi:hypothetical protein
LNHNLINSDITLYPRPRNLLLRCYHLWRKRPALQTQIRYYYRNETIPMHHRTKLALFVYTQNSENSTSRNQKSRKSNPTRIPGTWL